MSQVCCLNFLPNGGLWTHGSKDIALATSGMLNATPNLPYALRFICEFRSEGGKPRGEGWWAGKIAVCARKSSAAA